MSQMKISVINIVLGIFVRLDQINQAAVRCAQGGNLPFVGAGFSLPEGVTVVLRPLQ